MTRYAASKAAKYLKERFGFEFTEEPVLERLEDLIWETGRRAQVQRADIVRTCVALTEDAAYVTKSIEKGDRAPFEPHQRGDFQGAVRLAIELERDVSELIGVHQATLTAWRLAMSNTPTLEEHTNALGELRQARAERDHARHEVTELLAAREEWEVSDAARLAEISRLTDERDDYAARLKATDRATTERYAALERKVEELEGDLADTQASLSRSIDEYHEKASEVADLTSKLAAAEERASRAEAKVEELAPPPFGRS